MPFSDLSPGFSVFDATKQNRFFFFKKADQEQSKGVREVFPQTKGIAGFVPPLQAA